MLEGKDFIILTDSEASLLQMAARKYLATQRENITQAHNEIDNLCAEIRNHLMRKD